ncbi:PepSY-associated TM helix domain-containing protein [Aeoliella sp.]|uniref:PepSY-associated TM helix domain-containing protein n=1 Tax=Aeoliella sp. TaxID=2795800 RepID=UPI003CCC1C86
MFTRRIHILLGAVVALPLCVQAFTGALLVFEREIDTWLNARYFYVDPVGEPLSLQQQFDSLCTVYPDMRPHVYAVGLPIAPDQATTMLAKPNEEVGPRRGVRFFVNPYTGEVTGNQPYHSTLMGKVYNLHRTFWLPRWGKWITSTSALLTATLVITGYLLHWVTRRQADTKSRGPLLRLHRRVGKYFGPLVFVIALNGAAVTYMFLVVIFVYWASGTEMPKEMREGRSTQITEAPGSTRYTLDELIARANLDYPEAQPRLLLQPGRPDTAVTVILKKPHEPRDIGGTFVSMDPTTGEPIGLTDFTDGELGNRAVYWIIHSHKGTWGGYLAGSVGKQATRVLWIVTALAATMLAATAAVSFARRARSPASEPTE